MYAGLANILQFVLAVLFLPVVVAATAGFHATLLPLNVLQHLFYDGILAYAVMHLFIFIPRGIYQFGQNVFSRVLGFSPAAASSLPRIFPGFPILLLLALFVCTSVFKMDGVRPYFIFFIGFTLAMHVALTAEGLYGDDTAAFKPHYFLLMSVIYVFNLIVAVFLLDLNFSVCSSSFFFKELTGGVQEIYLLLYRQLLAG